jgi:hypothetical protein
MVINIISAHHSNWTPTSIICGHKGVQWGRRRGYLFVDAWCVRLKILFSDIIMVTFRRSYTHGHSSASLWIRAHGRRAGWIRNVSIPDLSWSS